MKFIVPITIGAIIGYITNWLAIKMLFRPHYEKRIFGFKIPFTPGLIPKEMKRIAKSTGEAIASNLITIESISNALKGEKIDESLRNSIFFSINKLKMSKMTIKELLESLGENNYIKAMDFLEAKIVKKIMERINAEDFKNTLKGNLSQEINEALLKLANDNRKAKEIIPSDIPIKFNKYIFKNRNKIVNYINDLIEEPEIKVKILMMIENMAEEKLPKLLTTFLPPRTISEKVFEAIENQMKNEETANNIAFAINRAMGSIYNESISSIVSEIKNDVSSDEINNFCENILIKIYSDDNRGKLIISIEDTIKREIRNMMENFSNREIMDLMKNIDENTIESIVKYLKILIQRITVEKLPSFIEALDIAKIVEEQINTFEVSYAEKIILDIADKELRAITWLGALLGGIIGIITPLIS